MEGCADEQFTHHHLGVGHGFGPVKPEEIVAFVVISKAQTFDNEILLVSFNKKRLSEKEESVSRVAHTSFAAFQEYVAKPIETGGGSIKGVATATVSMIRSLRLGKQDDVKERRAICVLDKVQPGEHDGHAVLAFADAPEVMGETRLGILRKEVRAELALLFGRITNAADVGWAESDSSKPTAPAL